VHLEGVTHRAKTLADLPAVYREVADAWAKALHELADLSTMEQAIRRRDTARTKALGDRLDDQPFCGFLASAPSFASFRHRELFILTDRPFWRETDPTTGHDAMGMPPPTAACSWPETTPHGGAVGTPGPVDNSTGASWNCGRFTDATTRRGSLHVSVESEVDSGPPAREVAAAAAIWARAKARRDRDPEPATVEATVPGIRRRLDLPGAKLLLARRDGRPAGFALVAPRTRTLELFYLAVDPDAWGSGVGTRLLRDVEEHAREVGREVLELWVINDNERAIRVYERAGWAGTDEVERDPASGRLERRFLRHIS